MPDAVSELEQWVGEHGDALFRYARYRVDDPNVAADSWCRRPTLRRCADARISGGTHPPRVG